MLSELKKLKFSWPTIALLIFVVVFSAFPTIFWPGGFGIGKDKYVTTTTVETVKKDKQGNLLKTVEITAYNDGKTVWDWLSVLGVPLTLLVLGTWLQQEQQERAATLSKDQQKIADNNTKEEVLQTYFDQLSVLLIDKNLIALSNKLNSGEIKPEEQELLDSSLNLIRARTLSILRLFKNDTERKTSVIDFLIESDVIGKLNLDLFTANLSNAELPYAQLPNAKLPHAKLSNTNLYNANLYNAKLDCADLDHANLSNANLSNANLSNANLCHADISYANLYNAKLGEADLSNADLLNIRWNSETLWPADKSKFNNVKNIPGPLKKELNL